MIKDNWNFPFFTNRNKFVYQKYARVQYYIKWGTAVLSWGLLWLDQALLHHRVETEFMCCTKLTPKSSFTLSKNSIHLTPNSICS